MQARTPTLDRLRVRLHASARGCASSFARSPTPYLLSGTASYLNELPVLTTSSRTPRPHDSRYRVACELAADRFQCCLAQLARGGRKSSNTLVLHQVVHSYHTRYTLGVHRGIPPHTKVRLMVILGARQDVKVSVVHEPGWFCILRTGAEQRTFAIVEGLECVSNVELRNQVSHVPLRIRRLH